MRIGRTIGFFVLAVVGAALVWLGAGSLKAAQRERAAEAAWAESFGPLGDLAAKFPAHPTNDAARALEESARSLGIELRPRGEQNNEDESSRPKKTEWDVVRAPLEGWVDAQAAKAEGLPEAPSAPVAAYLAAHVPALDAIEKTLLVGPAPDWATDLGKLYAAPVPNVSAQMQLARVLVGRAEARAAAKNARAEESLRAAFTLTGALRGRPEVASQLVSIAATRLELGAVRRIPVDAAAWRERLKTLDPRGAMLATWKREAWVNHEAAKRLRPALRSACRAGWRMAGARRVGRLPRGLEDDNRCRREDPGRGHGRAPPRRDLSEGPRGERRECEPRDQESRRLLAPRECAGPGDPEDGRGTGRARVEALRRGRRPRSPALESA
jgi:hypothetical protein